MASVSLTKSVAHPNNGYTNNLYSTMASLFSKLNYKGQNTVLVLSAPESFEQALDEIVGQAQIITAVEDTEVIDFVLSFVMTLQEIEESINAIAPKLGKDAVVWFCYPKGTSKKYRCEFNRDTGWAAVAAHNLETVRMVAIDEDWSALRFRDVAFVKKITRRESFALTEEAKTRTTQKDV